MSNLNAAKIRLVLDGQLRQAVVGKDRRITHDPSLGVVTCLYQDMPVVVVAPDRVMLDHYGEPRDRGRVRAMAEFLRELRPDICVVSDKLGFRAEVGGAQYKPEERIDPTRILIPNPIQ